MSSSVSLNPHWLCPLQSPVTSRLPSQTQLTPHQAVHRHKQVTHNKEGKPKMSLREIKNSNNNNKHSRNMTGQDKNIYVQKVESAGNSFVAGNTTRNVQNFNRNYSSIVPSPLKQVKIERRYEVRNGYQTVSHKYVEENRGFKNINGYAFNKTPCIKSTIMHEVNRTFVNRTKPQAILMENTQYLNTTAPKFVPPPFAHERRQRVHIIPYHHQMKQTSSLISQQTNRHQRNLNIQKNNLLISTKQSDTNTNNPALKSAHFTLSTTQSNQNIMIKDIEIIEEYCIRRELDYVPAIQLLSSTQFPQGFRKAQSLEDDEEEEQELSIVINEGGLLEQRQSGARTERKDKLMSYDKILETERKSVDLRRSQEN